MSATHQAPKARHILITGASGGIGRALALAYAGPGVRLALGGRDAARLEAAADACRRAGAAAGTAAVDVTARAAMAAWIEAADDAHPLDLVIANAGISGAGDGGAEGMGRMHTLFAVNVDGTLNTILPAIARMRTRRRGHLALMSSLAGFRGQPAAPAYCASKAAVRSLGEGLRGRLARDGIAVTVICPGFVRTPMTAGNPFPMPLAMPPGRAAAIIRRGLERRRARIAFPLLLYLATRLVGALPPAWVDAGLARLPAKE